MERAAWARYRARDTRLGREVALKILPPTFSSDPDRLMRFEREARTLASLNHPNIAQIYGVEGSESDGVSERALVMELVEGENLSERLRRGPISLDEALPLARQIAEALEAAHDAGIIHRDLKPANIKVRADGTVKVLDFGLAKASGASGAGGAGGQDVSPATMTSPAMTMQGVILGTAAYMAPEQAKGKPVDRCADIWAFGCVFYEMLTGQRAFEGDDVSETLAAILRADPDWSLLPPLPPALRTLLVRSLERDLRRRIASASAIRFVLDDPTMLSTEVPVASAPEGAVALRGTALTRSRWPLSMALIAIAALLAALGYSQFAASPPSAPVVRFQLPLPDGRLIGVVSRNDPGVLNTFGDVRVVLNWSEELNARVPANPLGDQRSAFSFQR